MNRERAKELLPIIQAFAEGKDIQHRWPPSDLFVSIDSDANFELSELEWSIKPELREFYVALEAGYIYHSSQDMTREELQDKWTAEVIKVREVIE